MLVLKNMKLKLIDKRMLKVSLANCHQLWMSLKKIQKLKLLCSLSQGEPPVNKSRIRIIKVLMIKI